jgi:hypothetical protein
MEERSKEGFREWKNASEEGFGGGYWENDDGDIVIMCYWRRDYISAFLFWNYKKLIWYVL